MHVARNGRESQDDVPFGHKEIVFLQLFIAAWSRSVESRLLLTIASQRAVALNSVFEKARYFEKVKLLRPMLHRQGYQKFPKF